jgi:hypothetical protein
MYKLQVLRLCGATTTTFSKQTKEIWTFAETSITSNDTLYAIYIHNKQLTLSPIVSADRDKIFAEVRLLHCAARMVVEHAVEQL